MLNSIDEITFKLIICGKAIPESIANTTIPNIIIAGFVNDINPYLLGANIFLNPITEGGGIKTKLVEALAYNLTSVTYASGAIGIEKKYTGEKMIVIKDNDKQAFVNAIIGTSKIEKDIHEIFYQHFSNKSILKKLKSIL